MYTIANRIASAYVTIATAARSMFVSGGCLKNTLLSYLSNYHRFTHHKYTTKYFCLKCRGAKRPFARDEPFTPRKILKKLTSVKVIE